MVSLKMSAGCACVMGADFAVLAVAVDSPYESLEDLMDALSADLTSVNFGGGSAVGDQDHIYDRKTHCEY